MDAFDNKEVNEDLLLQLLDAQLPVLGSGSRLAWLLFTHPQKREQSRLPRLPALHFTYSSENGTVERNYNAALTHCHFDLGRLPDRLVEVLLTKLREKFDRHALKAVVALAMRVGCEKVSFAELVKIAAANNASRVAFDLAYFQTTGVRRLRED